MLQRNKWCKLLRSLYNEHFEVEDTLGHDYSAFVVGYYGEVSWN